MRRELWVLNIVIVLLIRSVSIALAADVGTAFMYQGKLEQSGFPLNGTAELEFTLWDNASSGSQIAHTLTRTDPVVNGLFNSWLDFGAGAFDGKTRWLQIAVRVPPGSGEWTTLSPRQALLATPYAQYAVTAKNLVLPYDGSTDEWTDAFVVTHTRADNDAAAIIGNHAMTDHRGTGVIGTGGVTGVSGRCYPSGNNSIALYYGVSASCRGGVGQNYAVSAQSDSSNVALGVFADADADDDEAAGGYFIGRSSGAADVYGVHGVALGAGTGTRYGSYGEAENSGIAYGGYFNGESTADRSYGLRARAGGSGSGINYGVVARAEGNGTGTKYGVYAMATGSGTETKYGVYGDVSGGGTKHAGYFNGNLTVTGAKSFQIDHPLDPGNAYLNHYCAEGPEPLNVYSGMIILDSTGTAIVKLPEYFESINRDYRYQLTPVGSSMPDLHVARKVEKNRFVIGGGQPGGEVSWEVKGVRNDAFMRQNGAPVKQAKAPEEQGKYLNPEFYGKTRAMAIHAIEDEGTNRTIRPVRSAGPE